MNGLRTAEIATAIPQLEVMSAALVISLILLGTPVQSVQDSVSAQRVEKLESRITGLEKQVLEYRGGLPVVS